MNYNGNWNNEQWKAVTVTQQPQLIMTNIDRKLVNTTYDRLMEMSEDSINTIVHRLICKRFDDASATHISECLLGRRQLLHGALATYL
jgi:hypothetical protein